MKKITTLLFGILFICYFSILGKTQTNPTDSLALVALYNATDGSNWTNTWDLSQPVYTWYGVTLDGNRRVSEVNLESNELDGIIPPEIGNLNKLNCLRLHNNQLSSSLPLEMGNLNNLTVLVLYNNQLNGSLPSQMGNLNNLTFLNLSDNQFSGSLPSEIGNLNNLTDLWLHNNQLSGSLPPEIGNLNNLTDSGLYNNQFSGGLPSEIGNLNNLNRLYLYNNQLSGNLPPEIGNLNNLTNLYLHNNQLNGNLPPEIGNLNNLSFLNLDNNQLSGNLPPEIGNLNNLSSLKLRNNQLSGSIPPEIANLTNLQYLNLSYNQLSGGFPAEIRHLNNMNYLYLSNNQLSGCYDANLSSVCTQLQPIHNNNTNISNGNNFDATWEDFCNAGAGECTDSRTQDSLALVALYNSTDGPNWTNTWNLVQPMDTWYGVTLNEEGRVERLVLSDNQLNGNIPPEIGDLSNLTDLRLSNNQLTGNIPPEIENLSSLTRLFLSRNQLIGSIPTEIGNLTNLTDLHLDINKLNDTIPSEIGNLINLISLSLGSNDLSGSIPPEIGNLSDLWSLSLDNMPLTGSIPPEIGNLDNLVFLYLQNSNYSGSIPTEIGNMDNLLLLWASDNQFSGTIPDLSNLNTSHVRLYRNNFSHEDILANYAANNAMSYFLYSPQYHGEVQSHIVEPDTSLTLSLSAPLPGNNNQNVSYQWKKNDIELAGSTDSTFTITNLQISDVGKYTLHMTDSTRVADLEVISEPIYVRVPGFDLYGQPVEYNQIMMQFDNEADRIFYKEKYLDDNGWELESCNCNRGLYLWQFESETDAVQVLLDIDTKRETQTRRATVDGGPNNIFNLDESNDSGTVWSWTGDYTGATYQHPVRIFMLDSGLDDNSWEASPYLLPNAPRDDCYNISASGYDYTDTSEIFTPNYMDSLGHGTFGFRSVVEGLNDYMDVKAIPLKVFKQNGEATLFRFICALYHAIDHDADIVNISAGYRGQPSEILAKAVQLAQQKGIFIVTATGNDTLNIDSTPQFPAYFSGTTYEVDDGTVIPYDNVISVASINAQNSLSTFSNYGINNATLAAYGENMSGYGVGGENVIGSGTSISTFYVTRELATEIAKDKSRNLQDIWSDFEMNKLVSNPPTQGLTKTGKRLDIQIDSIGIFSPYCDAQGTNTNYEFIQSVTLNGQTNSSGDDGGYGDYTSTTLATLNGTNTITLTPGFVNYAYPENWTVWIDFNKDRDFDDADEQVYTGTSTDATPLSGTFSAPLGVGTTMMRIVMTWNGTPASCSSFTYGEVEDYKVELLPFLSGSKAPDNYIIDMHNSPNPFTYHTTITYTLPEESPVTLIVYDGMGRKVALLHDNELKPIGEHTVHFEGGNYPAGMYYYTIRAGAYSGTQKMILAR